jgi:hypothetical protein
MVPGRRDAGIRPRGLCSVGDRRCLPGESRDVLGRGVDKAADLAAARKVLAARSQHDNGQCRIGLGPLASGLRGTKLRPTSSTRRASACRASTGGQRRTGPLSSQTRFADLLRRLVYHSGHAARATPTKRRHFEHCCGVTPPVTSSAVMKPPTTRGGYQRWHMRSMRTTSYNPSLQSAR